MVYCIDPVGPSVIPRVRFVSSSILAQIITSMRKLRALMFVFYLFRRNHLVKTLNARLIHTLSCPNCNTHITSI